MKIEVRSPGFSRQRGGMANASPPKGGTTNQILHVQAGMPDSAKARYSFESVKLQIRFRVTSWPSSC